MRLAREGYGRFRKRTASQLCDTISSVIGKKEVWLHVGSVSFTFVFCWFRSKLRPLPILWNRQVSLFFFFFFGFLGLHLWHMADPRLGSNQSCSCCLCYSHNNVGSKPHLQPVRDPLTHWARPGIEPTTSWILFAFIALWAMRETPWWAHSSVYDLERYNTFPLIQR